MATRPRTGTSDVCYRTLKVPLPQLAPDDFDLLVRLRRDAGELWSALVVYHRLIRKDGRPWPTLVQLAREMTGMTSELGLVLGTQSQNLLFTEFLGVVEAATEARRAAKDQGKDCQARYPWRERAARDTHWDRCRDAKRVPGGFKLAVAMAKDDRNKSGLRRQRPLFIPYPAGIPKNCVAITIHYDVVERRFYLLFKIKEKKRDAATAVVSPTKTMGSDLGQIRLAACMTEAGESLNVKGRGLRSIQQGLQKKLAFRRSRLDRKRRGSRRRRREAAKLAKALRRARNQVRNLLHTTSRRIVDFAKAAGVGRIYIGDATGVRGENAGRRQNQANGVWPTGQLIDLVRYKAEAMGIEVHVIDERGTTRTCPRPGCDRKTKPRGRVYCCPGCGLVAHRDAVGGWNICARGYERTHGRRPELDETSLALSGQTYLTPVGVRGVRTSPAPRNPFRIVRSAEQPRSAAQGSPKHVTRGKAPDDGVEQALPGRVVSKTARLYGLSGF